MEINISLGFRDHPPRSKLKEPPTRLIGQVKSVNGYGSGYSSVNCFCLHCSWLAPAPWSTIGHPQNHHRPSAIACCGYRCRLPTARFPLTLLWIKQDRGWVLGMYGGLDSDTRVIAHRCHYRRCHRLVLPPLALSLRLGFRVLGVRSSEGLRFLSVRRSREAGKGWGGRVWDKLPPRKWAPLFVFYKFLFPLFY